MTIKIDGTDITEYVAAGGFKWSRNDIDAPGSGRDISGYMHRGRVSTKIRLDISCRPLRKEECRILLSLIQPEFVTVEYDDPLYGYTSKVMYANNNSVAFWMTWENGVEWYTDIEFPLVER